jgi:hypothetical protein
MKRALFRLGTRFRVESTIAASDCRGTDRPRASSAGILIVERAKALRIRNLEPVVLRPPGIERRLGDAVLPTEFRNLPRARGRTMAIFCSSVNRRFLMSPPAATADPHSQPMPCPSLQGEDVTYAAHEYGASQAPSGESFSQKKTVAKSSRAFRRDPLLIFGCRYAEGKRLAIRPTPRPKSLERCGRRVRGATAISDRTLSANDAVTPRQAHLRMGTRVLSLEAALFRRIRARATSRDVAVEATKRAQPRFKTRTRYARRAIANDTSVIGPEKKHLNGAVLGRLPRAPLGPLRNVTRKAAELHLVSVLGNAVEIGSVANPRENQPPFHTSSARARRLPH